MEGDLVDCPVWLLCGLLHSAEFGPVVSSTRHRHLLVNMYDSLPHGGALSNLERSTTIVY